MHESEIALNHFERKKKKKIEFQFDKLPVENPRMSQGKRIIIIAIILEFIL